MDRTDSHELWEYVLSQVELSISPANFNTWFRDSGIVKIEDVSYTSAYPVNSSAIGI